MKTLAGRDLKQYLQDNPGALIIDLRSRQAFAASHIRGAVNVPYASLERVKNSFPEAAELIFYCERGGSAMAAARRLSDEGRKTVAVIGAYRDISRLTETVSGFKI